MKEFSAQTGGRYTYVDDIVNLQELSLAFGQIFSECDNFVVSGCTVSGNAISAGYIYLNGKLRRFNGASGITTWPQYIYETNRTESVAYASGADKVGRTIYECAIASTVPTTPDLVTGQIPVALVVTSSGAPLMKDVFVGKYALLLNPEKGAQTVNNIVNFADDVNVKGLLKAWANIQLLAGTHTGDIKFHGTSLIFQSTFSSAYKAWVSLQDGVGVVLAADGWECMTVGKDKVTFNTNITTGSYAATVGSVKISGTHIFNSGTATNSGELNINMVGYNGGTTYSRNTFIGNGKNKALLAVYGDTNSIALNATTTITTDNMEGMVLASTLPYTNVGLQKIISWKDSNAVSMACIGFANLTDQIFHIDSTYSNIAIKGLACVDIGPVISEGGVLLSNKYALKTDVATSLSLKANSADVYTKIAADAKYALLSGGLSQFVNSTNTQALLRQQIGALGNSDMTVYPRIDKYLSDMATSDTIKKQIRTNIGAAGVDEFQTKLRDSGWIRIGSSSLYVRQIGNIVSVQGTIYTIHSGTVFMIPNTIDPPTYAVHQTVTISNNRNWSCCIPGGTRTCKVSYCNGSCGYSTYFSLTYMV